MKNLLLVLLLIIVVLFTGLTDRPTLEKQVILIEYHVDCVGCEKMIWQVYDVELKDGRVRFEYKSKIISLGAENTTITIIEDE